MNTLRSAIIALSLLILAVPQGRAQDLGGLRSDILLLDTDRMFTQTLLGQRILSEYDAERDAVIARNAEIDAQLAAEEQALTAKRPTMTPAEFREAADAFDAKVQEFRRESEAIARELERRREIAPLGFRRTVRPVLTQLMVETGAAIILERRNALLWAEAIDVTDLAIRRIDAAIGDGADEGEPALDATDGTGPQD